MPDVVVGREAESGVLTDLLAAAPHLAVAVVLDGEPGIGKTTLFEATLADARDQGFAVFT